MDRMKKKDNAGAIQDFSEAIRLDPKMAPAYKLRGNLYNAGGNAKQALIDLDEAVRLAPKDAESYMLRAYPRGSSGDNKGAVADLSKAIELGLKTADTYGYRAIAYWLSGNITSAFADMQTAYKMDAKHPLVTRFYSTIMGCAAANEQGIAFGKQGNATGAIEQFTQAITANPKSYSAYSNRAMARHSNGDADGALADAHKALELEPAMFEPWHIIGQIQFKRKAYQQAVDAYTEGIERKADIPHFYDGRGQARFELKDYDGALADFNQAIKLDPKLGTAYRGLSMVYLVKDDRRRAIQALESAYKLTKSDSLRQLIDTMKQRG